MLVRRERCMVQKLSIALAAVCVVLAVGLVVAVMAYLPANDQINSLNAKVTAQNQTITSQNTTITSLQAQLNSLSNQNPNSQVTDLQNEIASLQDEISSLSNIINFNASSYLVNNQQLTLDSSGNATLWDTTQTPLIYAGLVKVLVTPASNSTFAEVIYSSSGLDYDTVMPLTTGTALFPVLPAPATILLGTTSGNPITVTLTVIYYY